MIQRGPASNLLDEFVRIDDRIKTNENGQISKVTYRQKISCGKP